MDPNLITWMRNKLKRHDTDLAESTMQIIYNTTLAEAVNAVTITTDNNGNPLSLKKAELRIIVPAGINVATGTSASMTAKINDIATGYRDSMQGTDTGTSFTIGVYRNVWGLSNTDMAVVGGGVISRTQFGYSDGTTRNISMAIGGLDSGITAINKLYLAMAGSYTLPAGTKIEIRGSKA